ncbi:spindle and kinetochore-associated protein 2-like [Nycticebus coucang]|uniref:spindle and kinetochore-associated protein 2-like n=1 Tax=Nycticebus coucang TaxID=9470 RepID=UPI00234E166A|nr:spindle and kinetochore-associated protein 2-like [Nycticebus coucang]
MEAKIDKLELMFQKTDSDLDYIQYRLEYEIKTNHPEYRREKSSYTSKEMLAIKSCYQNLYAHFKPVAVEQKETKSRICATVSKTLNMIRLQKQTDLQLSPLTEQEKNAAEQLKSHMPDLGRNGLPKGNSNREEINSRKT